MARILVVSSGGGDDDGNAKNKDKDDIDYDDAAVFSDSIDGHNRPRMRRDVILSSLGSKYATISSFVAVSPPPSSPSSNDVASMHDLIVYLYSRVHDASMVRFLLESWNKWMDMGPNWDKDNCHPEWNGEIGTCPPLIPLHSAFRCDGIDRPSTNVMGAIGYYCTDFITPIVGTLAMELAMDALAICRAAEGAFLPASSSGGNAAVSYAVTTHPGHHACRDCFGGYCYLNNAALTARLMQRRIETGRSIFDHDGNVVSNYWDDEEDDGPAPNDRRPRVAIIDVDYHCGNGTASIFYRDPDVFFVSIHCDPEIDYPWNAGYADQTGIGDGLGTTMHVPLQPGSGWHDVYESSLRDAMSAITNFDPSALVVSLGLDTHEGDAVAVNRGGFRLSGRDYYEMGMLMGKYMSGKDMPCVFVQEGGYKMDVVGDAAADVVGGYAVGVGGAVVGIDDH